MLAQAQAGRILAGDDPRQAAAAFERIEQAALQALTSMDRHRADAARRGRSGGPDPASSLADLRELADRFSSSGTAAVHLDLGTEDAPREVAATAYRIVVEALTNVRAPRDVGAHHVRVAVHHNGSNLEVTVTDDGAGPALELARVPG